MHATETSSARAPELETPRRNRYFHGKLLDVYHYELETNYANSKRWLLNRLVLGWGVVCGLNVQAARDSRHQLTLFPGVAIDRWGREIVVPSRVDVRLPEDLAEETMRAHAEKDEERCLHMMLCYHECDSDPVPVLAGECGTAELCAAGTIRERYRIVFRRGCLQRVKLSCTLKDVLSRGEIDYDELVKYVSRACPRLPEDPCIPLANIFLDEDDAHRCHPGGIDISVRRIVYTNRLLFELLVCQMAPSDAAESE